LKNKKGVELTLQTIIVAILMLTVLVVMILIFTGMIKLNVGRVENITNSQISGTCKDAYHPNYQCVDAKTECCDDCLKWSIDAGHSGGSDIFKDCSEGEICCKRKDDKLW
jgi:hypothetical protein